MPIETKENKRVISTQLPDSVLDRLRSYCRCNGMSITKVMEIAIVAFLKKVEK